LPSGQLLRLTLFPFFLRCLFCHLAALLFQSGLFQPGLFGTLCCNPFAFLGLSTFALCPGGCLLPGFLGLFQFQCCLPPGSCSGLLAFQRHPALCSPGFGLALLLGEFGLAFGCGQSGFLFCLPGLRFLLCLLFDPGAL